MFPFDQLNALPTPVMISAYVALVIILIYILVKLYKITLFQDRFVKIKSVIGLILFRTQLILGI